MGVTPVLCGGEPQSPAMVRANGLIILSHPEPDLDAIIPKCIKLDTLPRYRLCGNLRKIADTHHCPSSIAGVPEGWISYITPEGDTYFCHPRLHVVTPADVTVPKTLHQLVQGYDQLKTLHDSDWKTERAAELFLDLCPATDALHYYFIDRARQHPFWVEPVEAHLLGLPPFDGPGFLSKPPIPSASPVQQRVSLNGFCFSRRINAYGGVLDTYRLFLWSSSPQPS